MTKPLLGVLALAAGGTNMFAQTLYVPAGTSGIAPSQNGYVGVNASAPVDVFQVNTGRPILMGNNGTNGVYGSHLGFNMQINTAALPNTVTKLGGTAQMGGAIVTVDYWGNYRLQTYNAGSESASTINYAPQFNFTNSGALGIGTDYVGSSRLVVAAPQSTATNTVVAEFTKHGSSSDYGSAIVRLSRSVGGESADLELNSGGSGPFRYGTYSDTLVVSNQNASNGPYGSIHLVTNQAPRLTVGGGTLAGNVGVGTATPGQRLDVNGATRMRNTHFYGANDEIGMISWGSTIGGGAGFGMIARTGRTLTLGANNQWDHLVVSTAGYVGIGTATPSHKLSVNGAVRAKEVIVETTGWSDYVFAPDYELQSLSEVEAHIKEHQHLPGIPSATEVAEQGVSVGEMQAKLLAKIEELTLHVIAEQKHRQELEAQLAEQRAELEALKSGFASRR